MDCGYYRYYKDYDTKIEQYENEIAYESYEIYSITNWQPWINWISEKYQPIKIIWTSEEDIPRGIETMDFYNYKKIVHNIIQKIDHSKLTGIDLELDEILKHNQKK
jgi:hypothetical protein